MTTPTVAVTVRLAQLTGVAPIAGVTVTATLDKDDRYGGFLVASSVSGVTDVNGVVVLACFPNHPTTGLGTTGSVYTFACKAWSFRATAQVPNAACELHDIADMATVSGSSATWGSLTGTLANQTDLQAALDAKQALASKDASGGYAGLTLFKLNLKNALGTITSFFTTAATVARTWTMPDKDGTVAMTSDISDGALNHAASEKSALVDADEVTGGDSAASFGLIRTTWASVAAYLQAKTDLLYLALLPTIIKMGGTTSSFPMLKRNAAGIDVRLADDSGYAALTSGALETYVQAGNGSLNIRGGSGAAYSFLRFYVNATTLGASLQAANGVLYYGATGGHNFDGPLSATGLTTGAVTKTANYTSTASDDVILADATAGNVVITLEAASGAAGRHKTVKKIDASVNTVTIDGNASETIDGATTVVLSSQWATRRIQVNAGATAWNVLASI